MSTPDDLPARDDHRARLRAADADREFVHQILAAAMTNGALTPTEFQDRAGKAVVARTFGELDELTDDLPVAQLGVAPPVAAGASATRVSPVSDQRPVQTAFAMMSGHQIRGNVAVADTLTATAIMGGVEIDLRDVRFTASVLTIRCTAIMGGIEIVVPPDVGVESSGLAIMGGFGGRGVGPGAPGAPHVRVTGLALMGGVEIKRRERGER